MNKWDEVTPQGIQTVIEYLKQQFDPVLAYKVIEYFHERMQDDEFHNDQTLHMLMKNVFARIIAGESADQALGLKRSKGRYNREDTFERDICAASLVTQKIRKGTQRWAAVTDAAEELGIGERIVERAYDKYKEGFEWLPDESLQQITASTIPPS